MKPSGGPYALLKAFYVSVFNRFGETTLGGDAELELGNHRISK
jgi:hypothetical protein